jgi:hypothetical protein
MPLGVEGGAEVVSTPEVRADLAVAVVLAANWSRGTG